MSNVTAVWSCSKCGETKVTSENFNKVSCIFCQSGFFGPRNEAAKHIAFPPQTGSVVEIRKVTPESIKDKLPPPNVFLAERPSLLDQFAIAALPLVCVRDNRETAIRAYQLAGELIKRRMEIIDGKI